ncbi:MAG TPA: MoxR family ATPase [Oligoflexia bacterium]|nr:MoxR family ATPase [Oligoflexia bacterium]HMP47109.1 MoxR family ATPase [Oligoflexia bacterium]
MESVCRQIVMSIKDQLNDVYLFGTEELLEYLSIAYLSRGHVLIEGPPGTAKTLCAKLMARVLAKSFNRIQFTSDMLPGDILGAHMYSPTNHGFEFIKGPIFADFILADEVNRTPPRTQSALLEAMEERQVSSEGKEFRLSPDFFVVATQNPRDFEGTFPLPEAQLDRFIFKISTGHASIKAENEILDRIHRGVLPPDLGKISPLSIDWGKVSEELRQTRVDASIIDYISRILAATRSHPSLSDGSSVRGSISLLKSSCVLALIRGRDFVVPDDIKELALPTLRHRIRLSSDAIVSGVDESEIIEQVLAQVPFPE